MASPLPPDPSVQKQRLDIALVARGLARSRGEAQGMIGSGAVNVSRRLATKASQLVSKDDLIEVTSAPCRYVSRGGLKLEAALEAFKVDVSGRRCLDVGASTGGFTDCLLQHGASSVTAVDVGHAQMERRLSQDSRVRNFEGINARNLRPEEIGGSLDLTFDLIATDLSFISLTLVLPALPPLLADDGRLVLLIKPQFEVGRDGLGKRGVVSDPFRRGEAVERVCSAAVGLGLAKIGVIESPITGGDGNHEYLAAFIKTGNAQAAG